jgi:hypothetical protein
LIRTVLSALPTYLLTVLKPPKKFYKEFKKMRRPFLWAGDQELHGSKCKVNWSRACRPLKYGGLGVTELTYFSRALRLPWLWFRWKKPESPWCSLDMPIDCTNQALFAAATRVQVKNGRIASF